MNIFIIILGIVAISFIMKKIALFLVRLANLNLEKQTIDRNFDFGFSEKKVFSGTKLFEKNVGEYVKFEDIDN